MSLKPYGEGVMLRIEDAARWLSYMPLEKALERYRNDYPDDDAGEIALMFQAAKRTIIRRTGEFKEFVDD